MNLHVNAELSFQKKKKKKKYTKYTYRTGVSKIIRCARINKPSSRVGQIISPRFVFCLRLRSRGNCTVRDISFFSFSSRNVVVGLRARRFNTLLAIRPPRRELLATWLFQQISRLSSNDHNAAKSVAHWEHLPSALASGYQFSTKIAENRDRLNNAPIRTFIVLKK